MSCLKHNEWFGSGGDERQKITSEIKFLTLGHKLKDRKSANKLKVGFSGFLCFSHVSQILHASLVK